MDCINNVVVDLGFAKLYLKILSEIFFMYFTKKYFL